MTVCEIKYRTNKIGKDVIPEMERKCALLNIPKGYAIEKALISLYGPDSSLEETNYFNYNLTLDDIF